MNTTCVEQCRSLLQQLTKPSSSACSHSFLPMVVTPWPDSSIHDAWHAAEGGRGSHQPCVMCVRASARSLGLVSAASGQCAAITRPSSPVWVWPSRPLAECHHELGKAHQNLHVLPSITCRPPFLFVLLLRCKEKKDSHAMWSGSAFAVSVAELVSTVASQNCYINSLVGRLAWQVSTGFSIYIYRDKSILQPRTSQEVRFSTSN